MRKFNLFNFIERKIDKAELTLVGDITERLSFKELALHIAISYIANTLSKCEIQTFEKKIEKHDKLYYMFNVSPNPNENSSQFINNFIEKYFYENEALILPYNNHLYCADTFNVNNDKPLKGYTYTDITFGTQHIRKTFLSSDVFHFRLDNKHIKRLVDSLYCDYGTMIDLAMQSFARTNGKKYKLLLEQQKAGDPNFNKVYEEVIKEQLKIFFENENAIYPQYRGTDLQEFSSATPTLPDSVVALRKEVFETTAQAFKIPMSMMYGNITNMNEIVKVYLSICIDPIADMISEELTRKYYGYDGWKVGNYIKVDTSCINHVDIFEVADRVDKLVASGVMSIDEIRPRLNLNRLDTEFSTSHFLTKNYDVADNVLKTKEGGDTNEESVLLTGKE